MANVMKNVPGKIGTSVGVGRRDLGSSAATSTDTAATTTKVMETMVAAVAGATPGVAAAPAAGSTPSKFGLMIYPDVLKKIEPGLLAINPNIISAILEKTATQLARGAMQQLNNAGTAVRDEAINTIKNRNINPTGLMNYLERRVKVGEALNEMSKDWDPQTQQDLAEAFNMDKAKLAVMDAIVSLAILNDPELEDELRVEHMGDTSQTALLENRRIVWQYPPPGTPLNPPYVVLVAVEHQDLSEAQEVIDEIMGQLTVQEGFKVPKGPVVFKPLKTLSPALMTSALVRRAWQ